MHESGDNYLDLFRSGGGNVAVLKVNGQLRHVLSARYIIPNATGKRGGLFRNMATEIPGTGPGRGAFHLTSVKGFSTYAEGQQQDQELRALLGATMEQRPLGRVYELALLFTKDLRVDVPELSCTHMAARCRRYVGSVGQDDYYQFFSPDPRPEAGRGRITMPGSGRAEMAIEDMCPFAFAAMVEQPLNQRLSGGSGLEQYSIKGNPGVPGALSPYVK